MIEISDGSRTLGKPGDDRPGTFRYHGSSRRVSLDAYRIARDPVTNEVYDAFIAEFRRHGGPGFEHPV